MLVECIFLGVVVEVITELIVAASIFDGAREWITSKSVFFERLLSCGYCISFWVAVFVTLSLGLPGLFGSYGFHIKITGWGSVDLVLQVFVLMGFSNYIHRVFSALKYYVMRLKEFD